MNSLVDTSLRRLGSRGIGPLGYGCWRLVAMSPKDAQVRIEAALDAGMNFIDTADVYGLDWGGSAFGAAEELLGEVLSASPGLRERMVLASKGGIIPGLPYDSANLETACENSLRRLQVEQLDLYQVHRPDLLCHPQETARALENLVSSGKILHIGVSNYNIHQTSALMGHLEHPIVSQQPEFSALHLSPLFDGILDQCMLHGQLVFAWSPLAGGKLARQSELPNPLAGILQSLAQREGVSQSAIALAFVLAHPSRPVALIGSIDPGRIRDAAQALTVSLDRADAYGIIQASLGEALP